MAQKWLTSGWVMERSADLKRGEQGDSNGTGGGLKSGRRRAARGCMDWVGQTIGDG